MNFRLDFLIEALNIYDFIFLYFKTPYGMIFKPVLRQKVCVIYAGNVVWRTAANKVGAAG